MVEKVLLLSFSKQRQLNPPILQDRWPSGELNCFDGDTIALKTGENSSEGIFLQILKAIITTSSEGPNL